MPERINLGYVERLGLRRMIDARLRELRARGEKRPPFDHELLHGESVPWPPVLFRRTRDLILPSLDDYEQASDNR